MAAPLLLSSIVPFGYYLATPPSRELGVPRDNRVSWDNLVFLRHFWSSPRGARPPRSLVKWTGSPLLCMLYSDATRLVFAACGRSFWG